MMDERDLIARLRADNATLREQVRQLEETLAPSSTAVPDDWGLTTKERRVYACLASRREATRAAIRQALHSDWHSDPPTENAVHVYISKLRKKLTPFGIAIITVWAEGYRLTERRRTNPEQFPG
ncbi:winged helix family transcriptional regulator [Mesorhizobium sp. M4A.F.Ca.ET.090.04.2.1]|nr:winged helix family transcriptional regulator [Mesorhizobium sp. M4A.F.Ca.ET.090.04.2.1]